MGMSPNSLKIVLGAPGVKDKSVREITKGGITAFMESIILKTKEESEPFFVLDLAVVISLYNKWCRNLPTIQPFYAVKCNPNEALLGSLAALGCNFDCASKAEIEAVLALGVPPDRIVYANPCKAESHIKYAASVGVNLTTYDSVEEVVKIRKWHPKCSLLIRIKAPDDSKARRSLCSKYGSLPMEVRALLEAAHASKLNVIGVSFHIGSAATNLRAYHGAVAAAKAVFEMAASLGMPKMHVLNIGGGFVADSKFEETASVVRDSIETYFPNEPELIVISEPGRFFAETTSTLATNIIGKRVRNEVKEYWINDGIYGSFGCIMIDILSAPISCKPLANYNYNYNNNNNNNNDTCDDEGLMIRRTYKSTIFGPTCDSLDTVLMDYELPELQVSDWLVFPNMGAYAAAVGSNFNGFNSASILTYLASSSTAMAE